MKLSKGENVQNHQNESEKKFKTVKIKKRKSLELKGRGQTGALRNDEKRMIQSMYS